MSMRDEGVKAVVLWLSFVVGLCNISVVVWKGGELSQIVRNSEASVRANEARITALESNGSSQFRAQVAVDNEIRKGVELRLQKLESACESIAQIRESIVSIKKDMDYLTARRIPNQTTSTISEKPQGSAW